MSLGNTVREKPAIAIVIAATILVVAVWQPWRRGHAVTSVTDKWYYDLQSNQLVSVGSDIGRPPVTLSSGATAVEAHVFACGTCTGETFVGYLERWSDQAKAYFENPTDKPLDPSTMQLVAVPPKAGQGPDWVTAGGVDADAVKDMSARCAGVVVECYP